MASFIDATVYYNLVLDPEQPLCQSLQEYRVRTAGLIKQSHLELLIERIREVQNYPFPKIKHVGILLFNG